MFVILVYDVDQKHVAKVMKTCRKYLHHVQKSVFEGAITDASLQHLKDELLKIVEPSTDSICIYKMESTKYARKEEIGAVESFSCVV